MASATQATKLFRTVCLQETTQVRDILLEPLHTLKAGEWISKCTVVFIGFHFSYPCGKSSKDAEQQVGNLFDKWSCELKCASILWCRLDDSLNKSPVKKYVSS